MKLNELKAELKEKEKRRDELEIETDIIITEDNKITKNEISKDGKLWIENYNELEKLKAEISALKKGISACEEILEDNKYSFDAGLLKETAKHNYELGKAEALSKRNKEILEIIDKCFECDGLNSCKFYPECEVCKAKEKLKQQLTTKEEGEE